MGLLDENKRNKGGFLKKMQGQEMRFQLKDLEVTREFKIWDDASKQWFRTGQGMKMTSAITGESLTIDEIDEARISNDLWSKHFPNHKTARTTTMNRQIITDLGEGSYGFPITANKALQAHIDTIKATGGDPLKVLFLMKKPEQGQKEYTVSVLGLGTITPQPQEQPKLTLKPVTSTQITLNTKQPLNASEQALVDAYNGMAKEHQTQQLFYELYKQNKEALGVISDARLEQIFADL